MDIIRPIISIKSQQVGPYFKQTAQDDLTVFKCRFVANRFVIILLELD